MKRAAFITILGALTLYGGLLLAVDHIAQSIWRPTQ
jgi:hypothetical protein